MSDHMPTYPRCETCRWWQPHQIGPHLWPAFQPRFAGWCRLLSEGQHGALAAQSAPDNGILETSPDFGCVQHEPKETGR